MILIRSLKIHFTLILSIVFLGSYSLIAQSRTFASDIVSETQVDVSANAIDADLTTEAEIRAAAGIAVGVGAYSGNLEIEFPEGLVANTTTYIKVDTQDHLLDCLVGGSLGGLLADVTGAVLIGNQEFTVEAKNGNTAVLSGHSNILGSLATDNIKVVLNKDEDYFLSVRPSAAYDRISLTNRLGSLIGLNNTRTLSVSGAFVTSGNSDCGTPGYTSFSGNGLTLDLLNIGGANVTDPNFAIDGDPSTYSQLGLGLIGVAADIEQTIYFDTPSSAEDSFYIQLAIDPSLIQAGILNTIEVIAENGPNNEVFSGNLSSLLNVDVLGLLQSSTMVTLEVHPENSADRLTIRLSSLLNASLNQQIRIHGVFSAPARPQIDVQSVDSSICNGSSASLLATAQGGGNVVLNWYDAPENGNLLATVNSGENFDTPNLTTKSTFYVASAKTTCSEESSRVPVTVTVLANPVANDIDVIGNENPICSSSAAVLKPSSDTDGSFSWYFDADGINEITDQLVSGNTSYIIDSEGTLTVSGLDQANSPYTFYAKLTESTAACENISGELKAVLLNVVDSDFNASVSSSLTITIDDLINIAQDNSTITVTGTVSGNATIDDAISLYINNTVYNGILDANSNFSINVDGNDLLSDADGSITVVVSNGICSITETIEIDLPELLVDDMEQIFCESDSPVVGDLVVGRDDTVFFESLTSDVLIDVNTPLLDGEVYFAGILNLPFSILRRVIINVSISNVPPPTTSSEEQIFCANDNPVVGDIQVNEENVVFYDTAENGNEINPDAPLEDGRTYYVANRESGCESSSRLAITTLIVAEEPIILSGAFEDVCLNREYFYETASDKENYVWTVTGGTIIDGGTTADNFVNIRWMALQDNELSVSYTDAGNCRSDEGKSLTIAIISCGEVLGEEFALIVYNEFTPNGDGFNDFFKVEGLEEFSNTLEVYNRNGNLVFKVNDYQNNWTGIANVSGVLKTGENLPSGTYYYKINIPELERDLVGWLQLAR